MDVVLLTNVFKKSGFKLFMIFDSLRIKYVASPLCLSVNLLKPTGYVMHQHV